jgi:hypothetical protein
MNEQRLKMKILRTAIVMCATCLGVVLGVLVTANLPATSESGLFLRGVCTLGGLLSGLFVPIQGEPA